ncbi:MAG: ABC transporter permease, partial [Thermogutta sp.]|nr:ABC transporter permease [Thermogutta sp.]
LLSLGGGAFGVILGHGLIGAFSGTIFEQTGIRINALSAQPIELVLIPGLIALASIVGYMPALIAYRTDVAKALARGG